MKRLLIPLVAGLFVAQASYAGDVIKCTTESGVTYQNGPCVEGVAMALLLPSVTFETQPVAETTVMAPVAPRMTRPVRASLSDSGKLYGGMSDMQVLNNRFWGRPQHITRNREPRAWHEYWSYETGAHNGKRLHFVNSKLAGIEDIEPPVQTVEASSTALLVGRSSIEGPTTSEP